MPIYQITHAVGNGPKISAIQQYLLCQVPDRFECPLDAPYVFFIVSGFTTSYDGGRYLTVSMRGQWEYPRGQNATAGEVSFLMSGQALWECFGKASTFFEQPLVMDRMGMEVVVLTRIVADGET